MISSWQQASLINHYNKQLNVNYKQLLSIRHSKGDHVRVNQCHPAHLTFTASLNSHYAQLLPTWMKKNAAASAISAFNLTLLSYEVTLLLIITILFKKHV